MSEGSPKFIAIDEETNHEIVHGGRFGKANRAAYEPLDPSPQIDVLAPMVCMYCLPTTCSSGTICRSYAPHPSV